jgi:hypothetical protein
MTRAEFASAFAQADCVGSASGELVNFMGLAATLAITTTKERPS